MDRKRFLSSLVGFATLYPKTPEIEKVPVVVCIGEMGKTVWDHLILNHTCERLHLSRAANGYFVAVLQHHHRPRKVMLVAELGDWRLTQALDCLSFFPPGYGSNVVGFFTYAASDQAEKDLLRLPKLGGSFRVLGNGVDPRRSVESLIFRREVTSAIKLITWEILRIYG